LLGLDPPVPDLDFFVDSHDAKYPEHESGVREGVVQRAPGLGIEIREILNQGDFLVLIVPERYEPLGLGPRKTAPRHDGGLVAVEDGPKAAVAAALERERRR
jgi:hypothetical protein